MMKPLQRLRLFMDNQMSFTGAARHIPMSSGAFRLSVYVELKQLCDVLNVDVSKFRNVPLKCLQDNLVDMLRAYECMAPYYTNLRDELTGMGFIYQSEEILFGNYQLPPEYEYKGIYTYTNYGVNLCLKLDWDNWILTLPGQIMVLDKGNLKTLNPKKIVSLLLMFR